MKCEMYWGGIPCESENTILVNVKLASGGDKKIYMCPKCHYKYFGKRQRRPTPHALDGRESAPSQAVSSPEVLSSLQAVSSPTLPQVM